MKLIKIITQNHPEELSNEISYWLQEFADYIVSEIRCGAVEDSTEIIFFCLEAA